MAQIIAGVVATMDASGTGVVQTIQHTSAAHTDITHEFRATLPATADLFTAFTWSDVNTEGNVDASSGYADFNLALDQAKFAAALAQVIVDASGGKRASAASYATGNFAAASLSNTYTLGSGVKAVARVVLDREIRKEVENELDANGVLEYLEGDSLGQFSLALDASGGGTAMAAALAPKAVLRNFFLQIPNRTSVLAETDWSGNRLPVIANDEVAFVFNVQPKVYITEQNQTAGAAATNEASNPLGTAIMPPDNGALNGSMLTSGTRKIVFIIKVVAE